MTQDVLDALQGAGKEESETEQAPPEAPPAPTDDQAMGEQSAQSDGNEPPISDPEFMPDPAILSHLGTLIAQAEALKREFPDFDLRDALADPAFVRLTAPGVGVEPRRAWLALHPEALERQAAAISREMLARSLASGARRPREGGGQTGAQTATDYRHLPRQEQKRVLEQIRQAAARGEKVYP